MNEKKPLLSMEDRAEIRAAVGAEVAVVIREAVSQALRGLDQTVKDLISPLWGISQHQAKIEGLEALAVQNTKVANELMHEWTQAKYLAKLFEQREFLRSPEATKMREMLSDKNGLKELGAGLTAALAHVKSLREHQADMHKADPTALAEWRSDSATDVSPKDTKP